jgi:hypothetical protein
MPLGSHGRDANHCRKGVWGRSPRYSGFKAFDWKAGEYAIISNRINIGTAKILHQLPTVERTSSRISNKRVEIKDLVQIVDQEVGGSNPPSCTSKINRFSGRPKSKVALG